MEAYIIIVILFGIITLLVLSLLFFINRTYLYANNIERYYSPIKDYLEERKNILKKTNNFISNNLEHEKTLNKKIDRVINLSNTNTNPAEVINILKKTDDLLDIYTKLDKTYPKLKNNKEYKELKKELDENINRINYAKDKYNEEVTNYNKYKESKIIKILNKILKFKEFTYYKKELWHLYIIIKNMK